MNDTHKQFSGRVALVTGGTQGLGETVARMFAARGARGLVVCGRNREAGERVAAALGECCEALYVQADLAQVEDCRALIAAADKRFGQLHHLVNCAALTERGTILDTSPELFDRMFSVNVRAPFFLSQDAAKIMRREKIHGTIVNILSMSSHGGQPFICAYSGSKAALAGLTRNIGFSLMPDRIRVNGLNLGWMNTPGEDRIQKTFHAAADGWLDKASAGMPFNRLLETDEVARAVMFLSSDESGMMTGSVVDFDQSVPGAYEAPPLPAARLQDQEAS